MAKSSSSIAEQDPNSTDELPENLSEEPNDGQEPSQPDEIVPTQNLAIDGSQTEFTNPMLRGRSPREIEMMFEVQSRAMREQGQRLSMAESRPEPEPVIEAEDPLGIRDVVEQVVKRELGNAIQPFRDDLATRSRVDGRAALRQKYDDWASVEGMVDWLLAESGQPETPSLLETLYYTAIGIQAKQGGQPVRQPEPQRGNRAQIPQHRPSAAPMSPPAGSASRTRELTESERQFAKMNNMSPEEYIKWQDMDAESVATSDLGQENR
jgi:hypothetical protein